MNETDFSPHIRAALDRYTVPPMPMGFTDRLLAKATVESSYTAALPIARPRRSLGGRWRRSAIIVGSVGLCGMVTAAAAATGIFGDPVYVPVVSEALAKANIAPVAPKRVKLAHPAPARAAAAKLPTASPATPQDVNAERIADARNQIRAMWDDPDFRRLPKHQRCAQAQAALHDAMAQGDFTKEELIQTLRDLHAERQERRMQRQVARGVISAPERPVQTLRPRRKAEMRTPMQAPVAQPRPAIQKLRERMESATPEERAALRTEIQARRKARRAARQSESQPVADKPLQPPATQDVAEPPK